MRRKLIERKKKLEEMKYVVTALEKKKKVKRISLTSVFGDFDDEGEGEEGQESEERDWIDPSPAVDATDTLTDEDKKIHSKKISYNKKMREAGVPLRSIGLVYQCGLKAMGVARAGYNKLFRVHLSPFKNASWIGSTEKVIQSSESVPYLFFFHVPR
jgi:hypothetical protein